MLYTDMMAGYHDLSYADRDVSIPLSSIAALGAVGNEGIRLVLERNHQDITTNELGDTIVDSIWRGGNLTLEFVMQQVNKNICKLLLAPFRMTAAPSANVAIHNELGKVGHMASNWVSSLEAMPSTGSATALALGGMAGRRFKGYVIGSNEESMDITANFIPIRFRCLPFVSDVTSEKVWWDWLDSTP